MKKSKKSTVTETENVNTVVDTVKETKLPQHITKDDPEWDDYIVGLVENVKEQLRTGLINFYPAYIGFVDNDDVGFTDLLDKDKLMRILIANGYCPKCAYNFIDAYCNEKNDKGYYIRHAVITKFESEICEAEAMYEARYDEIVDMK